MSVRNQTEEERAQTPCFVGLCGPCNLIVTCAVDDPEFNRDNAKSVALWMRSGLIIEKRSIEEVRSSEWCKCERSLR